MIELYTWNDVKDVTMRLLPFDKDVEFVDYSALNSIATCHRYGVINGILKKKLDSEGRAMALEAGSAFHIGVSMIKLMSIYDTPQFEPTMHRLFPKEYWKDIIYNLECGEKINNIYLALGLSLFYDDPRDKKRTVSNLEECLIRYMNDREANEFPIWMKDRDDPNCFVGIELPFLLELDFSFYDGRKLPIQYGGRIDSIVEYKGKPAPFENKTGSAINNPWDWGIGMSHQLTGYMVATQYMVEQPIDTAIAHGVQIPLPISLQAGIRRRIVHKNQHMIMEWLKWVLFNYQFGKLYETNPEDSIMQTHSCNRYFKECPFIPLCDANSIEDVKDAITNSLVPNEWSPFND